MQTEDLKLELEKTIDLWVNNTFNFIQLQVLEKYCDNCLNDYIRLPKPSDIFEDWLNDCDFLGKVEDFFIENSILNFEGFQDTFKSIEDTMIN